MNTQPRKFYDDERDFPYGWSNPEPTTPPTAQEGVSSPEQVYEWLKKQPEYTGTPITDVKSIFFHVAPINFINLINRYARSTTTGAKEGKDGWVKVEEGLPEANQKVLLWLKGIDGFMQWSWEKESTKDIKINGMNITHWMPLPSPPKN